MYLKDLVGVTQGAGNWRGVEITGLTADSREVAPGYLFAAMPGTRLDGTRFISQAIEKGAAAILLSEDAVKAGGFGVPIIATDSPRRELALMAARFYAAQPETAVAVTGTNGKTSVVSYVRQIWQGLGREAASLGTVGLVVPGGMRKLIHTSPDPVTLHRELAQLAKDGITHVALEASSHGLQQHRLDGVRFKAGAFTNITRDHLDYHASFEDYLAQKLRLFRELLPEGAAAVIDADAPGARAARDAAMKRGLRVLAIGKAGETMRLESVEREGFAQRLAVIYQGNRWNIHLPLVGGFQSANALVAAALCVACGEEAASVLPLLETLMGATGRLEHVDTTASGAPIFIDYAHTPDALANALDALRPYAQGRLLLVFGCGGDRDRGKRPQMGAAASKRADLVYVTDDNPRSEDAAAIRAEILAGAPDAIEIGDRRMAIAAAMEEAQQADVVLVAGKGHETGQIVGDQVIPFSDHEVVHDVLGGDRG